MTAVNRVNVAERLHVKLGMYVCISGPNESSTLTTKCTVCTADSDVRTTSAVVARAPADGHVKMQLQLHCDSRRSHPRASLAGP